MKRQRENDDFRSKKSSSSKKSMKNTSMNDAELLWDAAQKGHVDVATALIRNGANVNAADKWKRTALEFAASGGHVDIVKVLIQNGADVNAVDWKKWTHFTL